MKVPRYSPVTFQDPFQADQVWKGIDRKLAKDVRRGSADTRSTGSRGQARMRDAFIRRSSEESGGKRNWFTRVLEKLKDWL